MYAFASVLQQRGAQEQPLEHSLRPGLLVRLAQHPIWVIGLVCDVAGFGLQFAALGHGTLVLVQPLLVMGLLFALPLGALWGGRRLHRSDWAGAVLVCVGLAVFLVVANPEPGHANARPMTWVALLASVAAVTVVLVTVSLSADTRHRAVLLSAAAGIIYGAAAALTKTSSHLLSRGVVHVVDHWQPYVLIVFGLAGMLLGQSAFQAGTLDVSLPTMTVLDPIVSITIGALVFHEGISSSSGAVTLQVVSLIAMSVGIFMLARVKRAATSSNSRRAIQ
jgi:drug/metabolite transporter (DMT)-like permease